MTALLAAEVLKLRTTRTAWGLLAATVVLSALAVAGAVAVSADTSLDIESAGGVRAVLNVAANGAILVLVLGIIIAAGEYRHGTATDAFLTTPRRWRVIAAKLAVAAIAGIAAGVLSAGVSVAVAALAYRIEGFTLPLGSSDVWATAAGVVVSCALFGAIGAATGSLVRNQVVAIVGWLAWLFVIEHIAIGFLPSIRQWLPAAAGLALVQAPGEDLPSPLTAAVVLAMYAVAIMAAAIVSERYRDA